MRILLGFEVGTGDEVYLEDGQTVVTGMTQLSGKTTCLEALVERGKVTAVAFLTKRGESGFRNQREIPPYFKEQKKGTLIDWQYVSAILEAVMSEKMKLERSFIINACKGAHSLQEVYENIQDMKSKARRGFDESVYTNLEAYFEIILPEIAKYDFADKLKLRKGFNVLNLIGMAEEMQQLVIESVLSYVYEKMEKVVVVIPEAHKFVPQGLKTPVKGTALRLIKEGAGIGNYMFIDTQETTSTDKALLKQCSNWIMGYQQEKNEVKNVRENIGRRKISDEDIMSLKLGHFIASLRQKIYHVYVLPAGIDPEVGRAVAMGKIPVEDVKQTLMLERGEYVAREQEAKVEVRPAKDELVLGMGPDELADTVGKLRTELGEANRKLLDMEEKLHHAKVGLQKTVEKLEIKAQGLLDEVSELELRVEGIAAQNEQLQKDKNNLMETVERQAEELSQFTAFKILLAGIIGPYLEFPPQISNEEMEKIRKDIAELKRPVARRRRASTEEDSTGIEWVDIWLQKLSGAGQKILRFMAGKYPLQMTKSEIAIGIGLTASGGYFNGAFNKLKKNRLIVAVDDRNFKLAEGPP